MYSLDVELLAYVLTADWKSFLSVREDIFLRIMDIVKASGTSFAFPSQTSYFRRDDQLDKEAGQKAEAEVRQWRDEGRLPFPSLPKEMISELQGTLDYPPAGSFKTRMVNGEETL